MDDEVLYGLGVDINSTCTFHDGDLKLSAYDENLVQAVVNRLNTKLDSLDLFYEGYGSVLTDFYGWRGNDETIKLMKVEINNALRNESRLYGFSADINYEGEGLMRIDLTLNPDPDTSIDVGLVWNNVGELEIVDEEEY